MMGVVDAFAFWAIRQNYLASDQATSGSDTYYGFLRPDGGWYILKQTTSGSTFTYRYAKGDGVTGGTYAANWSSRGSIAYDYVNAVFN